MIFCNLKLYKTSGMTPITPESIHHVRKDDIIYPPCSTLDFTDEEQLYYAVLNKVGTKEPGNFMLILQRVHISQQDGKITTVESTEPHIYQLDDEHESVKLASQVVAENWLKL